MMQYIRALINQSIHSIHTVQVPIVCRSRCLHYVECWAKSIFKSYELAVQDRHEKVKVLVAQLCPALCDPMDQPSRLLFPSMGFSRQEYWSGQPFSSPGNLPDPGNKPRSPTLQADSLPSEPLGKPQVFKLDGIHTHTKRK